MTDQRSTEDDRPSDRSESGEHQPEGDHDTTTSEPDLYEEEPGVRTQKGSAETVGEPSDTGATAPLPTVHSAHARPDDEAAAERSTARTICTVCGNETEALRFCGHCAAPLRPGQGAQGPERRTAFQRAGRRLRDAVLPAIPVVNGWQLAGIVTLTGLAVVALLTSSVGLALILGATVIPFLLASTMPRLDLSGRESPVLLLLAAAGGVLVGAVLGTLMDWVVSRWWFDTGQLNHGAAGYGGRVAEAAGPAPLLVVALNGVLIPLVGLGLALAVPFALRRWHQMRNEVMDGMTLGAIAGAGFAVGAAIVFAWPSLREPGPWMAVDDWTLLSLGLTLFRPIVLTGSAAVAGAGLWHFLLSRRRGPLAALVAGIAATFVLALGTVILQPRDLGLEVLLNFAVALLVLVALRLSLRSALALDQQALAGSPGMVVCPHCSHRTPPGSYCAHCGRPLGRGTEVERQERA